MEWVFGSRDFQIDRVRGRLIVGTFDSMAISFGFVTVESNSEGAFYFMVTVFNLMTAAFNSMAWALHRVGVWCHGHDLQFDGEGVRKRRRWAPLPQCLVMWRLCSIVGGWHYIPGTQYLI